MDSPYSNFQTAAVLKGIWANANQLPIASFAASVVKLTEIDAFVMHPG